MTNTGSDRHLSLDAIRGVAVMGILLLNAFSFALPDAGYVNPRAWGGTRGIDIAAWGLSFVLFEGKMRGLFSLLFGASMLLIVDRARAAGDSGASVHFRRMFWLLLFGLAHHVLVWEGDILVQYAIVGAVAYAFVSRSDRVLRRWAMALLIASVLMHVAMMTGAYALKASAQAPGATTAARESYAGMVDSFSKPGSRGVGQDLQIFRGDYPTILADRAAGTTYTIVGTLKLFGFETLGLMLTGMLLLRNGFLTGGWSGARYRKWARRAYLIGIPPLVILTWGNWASGFEALSTFATFIAWAEPFKYAVLFGHASLAMLLIARFRDAPLIARIAATGRMAFTNYLATSLIMTTLFYGYGVGLYGYVGRAEVYLFVFAVWTAMLAWSLPWLARFRYGPFEWAWRSLSRGERQSMTPATPGQMRPN